LASGTEDLIVMSLKESVGFLTNLLTYVRRRRILTSWTQQRTESSSEPGR